LQVVASQSAEIAIVGAGPAGSHLASLLAASGQEVVLFDPKGAWEKPCGGGVTSRALREFSFLLESQAYPRKLINRITIISPSELSVTVKVTQPFAIYSRHALNSLVLDQARKAGANFVQAAVADFSKQNDIWTITTNDGRRWCARFLVGADGAASFTRRRLIGIFPMRDLAVAIGYLVEHNDSWPGQDTPEEVLVRFPPNFTGYLWAFPRPGAMNFGVASKLGERTSGQLRQLVLDFVRDYYGEQPRPEQMSFFGAKIPTLDFSSWRRARASGDGWALIGDAAGFCDPITGEGIYYALKSAALLADAIEESAGRTDRAIRIYELAWRQAFGRELEHASYRLPQFYHGKFFGQVITDAMVRLARHHRGVRQVLVRALMGDQSYITLKRDLLSRALQIF
jgi:geranylgeranyl reductase family protein